MKNINKESEFNRLWEDAFKDAEIAPSEGMWDKIDSALSKEEVNHFKQRALIFKLLAAASIAFALSIISLNYFFDQNTKQIVLHDNTIDNNTLQNSTNQTLALKDDAENIDQESTVLENKEFRDELAITHVDDREDKPEKQEVILSILANNENNNYSAIDPNDIFSREFYNLSEIEGKGIDLTTKEEMIYKIDHIYLIPYMPIGASKKKKEPVSFMAGLDFSTGVFDPNFQQGGGISNQQSSSFAVRRIESFDGQLASFNTANKDFLLVRSAGQETQPEIAYSYGANLGFKLSKRIVLQTGIAYRNATTTTTTTGYIEEMGSDVRIPIVASYQYQLNGLSSVNTIPETDLKNQYEFASIPLRAGYMFLDKKVNLTLLAGISSDFLIDNQIEDKSNYLESISNGAGEGSPYKSVYFNGSLGTMLGYKFAENYLISVEPSYRFALNSFTQDDFYLNSYPSSFMVSLGVAYNFK